MTNQKFIEFGPSPLVEWFAGQITSPVLRLRFLRAYAIPRQEQVPQRPYKSWILVSLLVVLPMFTAPASVAPAPVTSGPPENNKIPLLAFVTPSRPPTVHVEKAPEIWQVEKTDAFESYSNGLRIENGYSVANHPRSYLAFSSKRPDDMQGERRSVPAGIVFHTTESPQARFESGQNSALKHIGESLLTWVKLNRSYNFLIDRFGRVYRVVLEGDAANHAGSSVWSDPEWLYLNLNESFLSVSFETQTLPGQVEATVNPAQVRSAAMLTDMLRRRYGIPATNCVTHAQVSVNASSLRIGYHLDWASSFPFDQLGLPDNYALALPSVALFGFEYDSNFARQAGVRLLHEAELGEELLRGGAAAAHEQVPAYRKALQRRYMRQLSVIRDDATRIDR